MRLVAIDPGRRTGWAVFDEGRMVACGVVEHPEDGPAAWCLRTAGLVSGLRPSEIVAEVPRIYPARRSKGDPNDLIGVACVAGAMCAICRTRLVEPREWKGTIPKPARSRWRDYVVHRRIVDELRGEERTIYEDQAHEGRMDAADAVGLGLWSLGRTSRGGA